MLYDEPTSALDSITERSVDEVLHASETDRTSIVVAHKLRLVQDADLILVMRNGTLVQQGTHEQLLAAEESTYAMMWAQQLRMGDERRGAEEEDLRLEHSRVELHSDRSGVHGAGVSIQSLRATEGIDKTLRGGGRGVGGDEDQGWLW